ncbi:hypothetical protein DSECCO2_418590 [anaerobic digester metagenome]
MSKLHINRFRIYGELILSVFAILLVIINELTGLSASKSLAIIAPIFVALTIFAIVNSIISSKEALSKYVEQEIFLCNYNVSPYVTRDFNKYFYDLNSDNRNLYLFLCMLGILIFAIALLIFNMGYLFVAEIAILSALVVLLIFNLKKKRWGLPTDDTLSVQISADCLVLDGELTIWNSDTKKITDVIFRKINNQVYYLSVYYNSYSPGDNGILNTNYLEYSSNFSDDVVIVENAISIPVPVAEKENVQLIVDEMMKMKIKRK